MRPQTGACIGVSLPMGLLVSFTPSFTRAGTNFVPLESRRLASRFCKIMRIVCTLSLGVYKHGSDIARILIGYVLSDLRFDLLLGNMGVFQENLLYSFQGVKN